MSFTLAIFDLDGTLLDTSEGIFGTANKTVVQLGLDAVEDEGQLAKFIGPPIAQCFVNVYDLQADLIDDAIAIYREEYDRTGRFQARPYDGIEEILMDLQRRGYRLAVGTLKYEPLARQMLEHFGLAQYFETIRGSDDASTLSKGDIVQAILAELDIAATDAVLVGDTVHDEQGAIDSGVAFLAVDWGFGFAKGHPLRKSMWAMARSAQEVGSLL